MRRTPPLCVSFCLWLALCAGAALAKERRILITPGVPDDCPEVGASSALRVCDKVVANPGGPIGELPCEDLEKIVPERTNATGRVFSWGALTPGLQKGLKDATYPPFYPPEQVAFALSYFRSCDRQKAGEEAIPDKSPAGGGSQDGDTAVYRPRVGGPKPDARPSAGPPEDAPPIMDPNSIPKELVFAKKPPPKKRTIKVQGLESAFLP